MITIDQITSPDDIETVRALVRTLAYWSATLDSDSGDAPTFNGLDAELANLPGPFAPPTGGFLLAKCGEQAVGCGAVILQRDDVAELKRMFVKPDQRGLGIGTKLVRKLIANARQLGARRLVLDSYHKMHAAHRLYRQAGFKDVNPWEGFPAEYADRVVFMQMDLD